MAARPYKSCQLFKGQPRRFALWELVPNWYKSFLHDHFGQLKIKDITMLSNETSTTDSCAEDQILEVLILITRFCTFVLKGTYTNFLKSGYQKVNINDC